MVDITPDMSPATLQDILENLRQRQKENLAFRATVWGKEVKEAIAREIEGDMDKVIKELRRKFVAEGV